MTTHYWHHQLLLPFTYDTSKAANIDPRIMMNPLSFKAKLRFDLGRCKLKIA